MVTRTNKRGNVIPDEKENNTRKLGKLRITVMKKTIPKAQRTEMGDADHGRLSN